MSSTSDPPLFLQRIDPSRNMARFYALSTQPTLFGDVSLIRNWGRIGTSGRAKVHTFERPEDLAILRDRIETAKRRRGYEPP